MSDTINLDLQRPSPVLRPYIRHYLFLENRQERINWVLPNASMVMVFRYDGVMMDVADGLKTSLPSAAISGLRRSARLFDYSKEVKTVLVVFTAAGAAAFFRLPLHELFEKTVSLDHFIPPQLLSKMEGKLAEAGHNGHRKEIIEGFLRAYIREEQQDQLVLNALQRISQCGGQLNMQQLANVLCISQDALEKRFRKTVGASPKMFSSIVRFRSVIEAGKTAQSMTELALNAGYFDQSHFNKDFRRFTGQTPTTFFNSRHAW